MLSTRELENYLKHEINNKIDVNSWDNIFFYEGTDNSIEGTYVFCKGNVYHVLFTEKGKIRNDFITEKKEEVLWEVLNIVSYSSIMDYAIKNNSEKTDFRKEYFAREIEIYSLFGEEFKNRKIEEIKKILSKNPYMNN